METLLSSFDSFFKKIIASAPQIFLAVLIIIASYLLGKLFHKIFVNRIKLKIKDSLLAGFISRMGKWSIFLFGFLAALHTLGFGYFVSSILAGAGITAIIIGFAFKDIAENFLSGIILAMNRPFNIGDIIELDNFKGTIKDLELRSTHIRTPDGRDIYIPNSSLIKSPLVNYTKDGLLRLDFILGVATESNINDIRKIILDSLISNEDILQNPPPNVITENIGVSSIDIRVLFWIDILKTKKDKPDNLGNPIRSKILSDVKDILLKQGYNLPSTVVEHKMYDSNQPLIISNISK